MSGPRVAGFGGNAVIIGLWSNAPRPPRDQERAQLVAYATKGKVSEESGCDPKARGETSKWRMVDIGRTLERPE
jgi:hypothetical protein